MVVLLLLWLKTTNRRDVVGAYGWQTMGSMGPNPEVEVVGLLLELLMLVVRPLFLLDNNKNQTLKCFL